MSTIEKLSIQGIRSYGPNLADCQRISFAPPVTLILGENGCGKTTIIECLKYALTGDLPPTTDRGKNFVYDPKIFDRSETLGQIKAVVCNKNGAKLSVCRSMKVSYKRGKASFETLDSTITFLNDPGGGTSQGPSISRRSADTDETMFEFMGVSRAVINNVLLCHQEDSSWPLDEPKKLKEKFDAIFGITEFNKALDKVIKLRKSESDELKVKEANLKFLAFVKKEMESKLLLLKKDEEKCQNISLECTKCDEELVPIEKRLQEISRIESDIGRYQTRKVAAETKLRNCQVQILRLQQKIKTPFEGSLSDVQREVEKFDQVMMERCLQKNETENELKKLKNEEEILQSELNDLEKKRCINLEQCRKMDELKEMQNLAIKSLSKKLSSYDRNYSLEKSVDVHSFLEELQAVISNKEREIKETSSKFDNEDQDRQLKIDSLRVEVAKCEENILSLEQQKCTYQKEINDTEVNIRNIERSSSKLCEITQQAQKADADLEKMRRTFYPTAIRDDLSNQRTKIAESEKHFKNIDGQLTLLTTISKILTEVTLKEEEYKKKEREVNRLKSKNSDRMQTVFVKTVTSDYKRTLQSICAQLQKEITLLKEQAHLKKLDEKSSEIERSSLKQEISRLSKELDDSKEVIFQHCASGRYEELLERSKENVNKYQLEHGAIKSSELMYKKYIQKLEVDPSCPLCHKNMALNEATDLSAELLEETMKLPDNIIRAENILKQEQLKYETLLGLRPLIEKVEKLENSLPKLRDQLKTAQNKFSDSANEYENIQILLAEPSMKLDMGNSMIGDMTLLDEAVKEGIRIKQELTNLKQKIPTWHNSGISIEDLQVEKKKIEAELAHQRKTLERTLATYEENCEKLNSLQELKNRLKEEQIKLQEGIQSLAQVQQRKNELLTLTRKVGENMASLKCKFAKLSHSLKNRICEKATVKKHSQLKLTQFQTMLNDVKSEQQELERLFKEISNYESQDLKLDLEKWNKRIDTINNQIDSVAITMFVTETELDEVKTWCLRHESLKRDLMDNVELKRLEAELTDLDKELQHIKVQFGDLDVQNLAQKRKNLMSKRYMNSVKKGELLGQIGEIKNRVKSAKRELKDKKYADATKNFKRAQFELIIARSVIEDLNQFRMAMEWALIQFHREKMRLINCLIREYWRLIYRGNDIDYIEIKTDETKDSNAERKRSYNYRVVQFKYNSELEMRGRCSAGQRVLASLIIRMALAETFSSNCGVFALDEPTANLDQSNIASLCEALKRIIEERQAQSFTIIVITHDESFVSALGKMESYYRITRNEECKSVIHQVSLS